jgi:uncharacterized protein (DUF1697 family)
MKYVALFRGINVGGKNKVLMADLRDMFEKAGFFDVKSYIQSGNVVFSSEMEQSTIRLIISEAFFELFGFQANILIYNAFEFKSIIDAFPFSEKEISAAATFDPKVTHEYIYFLNQSINQVTLEEIKQMNEEKDQIRVGENVFYFLCYESVRLSKSAKWITKRFPDSTARNWSTVNKIVELIN